jgi:hypothetical protein
LWIVWKDGSEDRIAVQAVSVFAASQQSIHVI